MGVRKIKINTLNNSLLRNEVSDCIDKIVCFSNGCWLDLREDNGLYWGTTPYGLDWACNANENWLTSVLTWLEFWDAPRDESGNLVVLDQ